MSQLIVPIGEGYILVYSCFPQHGYTQVKIYYSLCLTGIIINEEDFMGDNKKQRNYFSRLALEKFYSTEDSNINT